MSADEPTQLILGVADGSHLVLLAELNYLKSPLHSAGALC